MLDDIDREAIREGFAISRIDTRRSGRTIIKKCDRVSTKIEGNADILRILNIISGKPHGSSPRVSCRLP